MHLELKIAKNHNTIVADKIRYLVDFLYKFVANS